MPNRDMLLIAKKGVDIQHQLALLEAILLEVENMSAICIANEILDVNKYKRITHPHLIEQYIQNKRNKPFVFLCNKN